MVSRHVSVPKKLNANYSILGRIIRRSVQDTHYAEGILILTIALLCISIVVAFYIAWAFVQPFVEADATGQTAVYYFLAQIASFILLFTAAFLGFKPKLEITIEPHCLHIKQGDHRLLLLNSEIQSTQVISALQYHQHYRKYSSTKAFYNRLSDHLLLLETENGPIILGVSEEDQATLLETLRSSASAETNTVFEFVA